jgi:hypothetical protein
MAKKEKTKKIFVKGNVYFQDKKTGKKVNHSGYEVIGEIGKDGKIVANLTFTI